MILRTSYLDLSRNYVHQVASSQQNIRALVNKMAQQLMAWHINNSKSHFMLQYIKILSIQNYYNIIYERCNFINHEICRNKMFSTVLLNM